MGKSHKSENWWVLSGRTHFGNNQNDLHVIWWYSFIRTQIAHESLLSIWGCRGHLKYIMAQITHNRNIEWNRHFSYSAIWLSFLVQTLPPLHKNLQETKLWLAVNPLQKCGPNSIMPNNIGFGMWIKSVAHAGSTAKNRAKWFI